MQNNSPFTEGNQWRFTKGNQPSRTPTLKMQLKMLESLLTMSLEEVESIAKNSKKAVFLRFSAKKILEGNIAHVVDLIAKYQTILNGKEEKKNAKRGQSE